jgi:hypothetical protein
VAEAVGLGPAVDVLGVDRAGHGRVDGGAGGRMAAGIGETVAGVGAEFLMGKLLGGKREEEPGEKQTAEAEPSFPVPLALSPPYDHALLHPRN